MQLKTPLSAVIRTTKDFLEALEEMNLHRVEDLLLYLPRTHEDLTTMLTLTTAPLNEKVTIMGTVTNVKLVYTRSAKKLVTATFLDTEGATADVVWYNQPHIKRMLSDGQDVALTGKLVEQGRKIVFQSPQFEVAGKKPLLHAGRLVPIYPQHGIISSRWLREKIEIVKGAIDLLPETLPEDLLKEENFPSRKDAIRALHFPESPEDVQRAYDRLAFEDAFALQKEALEKKKEYQGQVRDDRKIPMNVELIRALFKSLKFTPTDDQRKAIFEILKDMESGVAMSRLLEGDVGSGKTLVATATIANVLSGGGQCALMVPTEVLARQHAQSIAATLLRFHTFLHDNGIDVGFRQPSVALLAASVPGAEADRIRMGLQTGTIDLVIGTHALLQGGVQFKNLALVIVDEQHRFGVEQRKTLRDKGNPHFLAMTATPIPRTLALTAYGHSDLSVLLTKPGNRKKIHTAVVGPKDRKTTELFIDRQIDEGRQVFVICPLIEGSTSDEMRDVKSVTSELERLRQSFPRRRIEMLHGKMSAQEKQDVMKNFKDRAFDILVSTSVIEVGIDVPNATVIVIESSERFGLAQLHQFRGRVGRSDHQSYCFLCTTTPEQANSPRLKAMEEHHSGFMLAEIDLKLRGPGELFGLRQSGIPDRDIRVLMNPGLIVRARRAAEAMLGIRQAKEAV